MPIPEDMAKFQLTFDLLDGSTVIDQAVTGFNMHARITSGQTTHWADWVQKSAEGVRDRWVEHIGTGFFSHAVRASVCKVYHLDTAGHTLDEGVAPFEGDTAWRGGQTDGLPWECSAVVSLYGYAAGQFVPNRARRRGRMYLPPFGTNALSGEQGRIKSSIIPDIVTALEGFYNDVQGMHLDNDPGPTDLHWDLAVLSTVGNSWSQVERWDIGDVIDVQRRRRNRQGEVRNGAIVEVGDH